MLIFISAEKRLSAAPELKLGEQGVLITNGAMKCSLAFPVPVNQAKAKAKILEKTVSETGVILKYEGGGEIDLSVPNGEIAMKISDMPADTWTLFLTMKADTALVANGKWQFDSQAGIFPVQETPGQIYQGNARNLSMVPPAGPGIAFSLPSSAFQQLQDLRRFQVKAYYWQCWLPFPAATQNLSIKINEATGEGSSPGTAAAAPASTPVAQAAAPKPAEDRQKWGQLNGIPEEKKTGTRILKWKDGKQAAFLLGFDDCGVTHLTTVIPELQKRKMAGNFYVNPGSPQWKKHLPEWEEAAKNPYVVLHDHTFLHLGTQSAEELEQDVVKTNAVIYALTPQLKNPRIIVFRTPGGVPWKVSAKDRDAVLAKYHMVNRPWIDGPPLTMKSLPPVLATVDRALAKGETGFVDFHGIGGDGNSSPVEWFTALLDKLDEHRDQIWITDTVSWFQYQEERRKSQLKVLQSDASQVRVGLTCSADPAYYDLSLTVAVEVPASWKECKVTQGAKTWRAMAAGGEVRFDVLPGADEIVVQPQ